MEVSPVVTGDVVPDEVGADVVAGGTTVDVPLAGADVFGVDAGVAETTTGAFGVLPNFFTEAA